MATVLILGFFLGLKHALEADHVAAVAAMAAGSRRMTQPMWIAAAWGVGHTAALVVFGSILLALDGALPPAAGAVLESIVGAMLIVLGIDVLRRLRHERIHFHVHEHEGRRHLHAHAHVAEEVHDPRRHRHEHRHFLPRALVVGGIHGMAGTAGLTLLFLQTLQSVGWAFVYLALFGAGTILGMVLLSVVIALPFRFSAERLTRVTGRVEAALGVGTILLGCWIIAQAAFFGSTIS